MEANDAPSVVIATLYEPITLDQLVQELRYQGIGDINVIHGKPTNDAWREGIEAAKSRYVMVLNDDIEVCDSFVNEIMYAHMLGASWVSGLRVNIYNGTSQVIEATRPVHRGEAFSIDKKQGFPPIPDEFRIFYGDEWYFWHGVKAESFMVSRGAQYTTDETTGHGYSLGQEDLNERMTEMIGHGWIEQAAIEHEHARSFFQVTNELTERRMASGGREVVYTSGQDALTGFRGNVVGLA